MIFCNWRIEINGKEEVEYRLPSESEWKELTYAGFTEKEKEQGFRDSTFNKLCRTYNYKITKRCSHLIEEGIKHASLKSTCRFAPNSIKLFDFYGNISEMTLKEGVSKGGNYLMYASQCHPDSIQFYTKPEKWLGFRCIGTEK